MKFAIITLVVIVAAAASPLRPVYSSRYASVYYQRAEQQETPQTVYGPPPTTESTISVTTEREETTTQQGQAGQIKSDKQQEIADSGEVEEVEDLQQEAVYYIYHPNGLLQRVVYLAKDDTQNMAYTAQLRYQNVAPITEPIYTYDPNTFVLTRLDV